AVAGEVAAGGGAGNGVSPGDRVIAMTGVGGFAEQAAVPAASVIALPANLGFGQAAALIQSYSTALFTLTRRTSVAPDEWVLVLGAGGGIGLACIDVAVALGAPVSGGASCPDQLDTAQPGGADAPIPYGRG